MQFGANNTHACGLNGTAYRGEEHSIWLSVNDDGYQALPLDATALYLRDFQPGGVPIPIFPLIAVVYSLAPADLYPPRRSVGIPDFSVDFGYALSDIEVIFDCDPSSPLNAEMLAFIANIDTPTVIPSTEVTPLPELGEEIFMNSGLGAELAVAIELQAQGWSVRYTGNQQRLGYDLLAEQGESQLRVEVKSSVGFTTPELTESEWVAATNDGDSYVLALVDFYRSQEQTIWYVRNPADAVQPSIRTTASYRLPRRDIELFRTESDFL